MPRETRICFVLRGIPYSTETTEILIHTYNNELKPVVTANEVQSADHIAFGSFPLFNYAEFVFEFLK